MVNFIWDSKLKSTEGTLGIDPSLTGTAWCYMLEDREPIFTDLPNKLRGVPRLKWIVQQLHQTIKTYKPTKICYEGYSYRSYSSSYDLAELGGLLRVMYHEYAELTGAEIIEYSPTELKKYITGKGNSKKEMMMLQLFKRFGIEAKNNNQADAVGLCLMGHNNVPPKGKK